LYPHVENSNGLDLGSDFILEFDSLDDLDTSRAVNALSASGVLVTSGESKYLTVEGRQEAGTTLLDLASGELMPAHNAPVAVTPQFRIGVSGIGRIIWLFCTNKLTAP
jgi:hypothetical protein